MRCRPCIYFLYIATCDRSSLRFLGCPSVDLLASTLSYDFDGTLRQQLLDGGPSQASVDPQTISKN